MSFSKTDHLCKPDLTILNPADPSFIAWRTAIYTLSKADNVYMYVHHQPPTPPFCFHLLPFPPSPYTLCFTVVVIPHILNIKLISPLPSPPKNRKLSGAFSEMPPSLQSSPPETIFDAISPWLAVVVAAFGPGRIMFGSDWPVCTIGIDTTTTTTTSSPQEEEQEKKEGEGEEGAWDKWRKVVERLCFASGFSEEETKMIFYGTARRAYRI